MGVLESVADDLGVNRDDALAQETHKIVVTRTDFAQNHNVLLNAWPDREFKGKME